MTVEDFFTELWRDYQELTPQAEYIHQALLLSGEKIVNDHVAFRTFGQSALNIKALERPLLKLGFKSFANYHFPQKKLNAKAYIHPDSQIPKIFLSELCVDQLSNKAQGIIQTLLKQAHARQSIDLPFFYSGRLWEKPSIEDYQSLLEESEYAAWLATIGYRANHFTILMNQLDEYSEFHRLFDLLNALAIPINRHGDAIKGSPEEGLEQAASLADHMEFEFSDGQQDSIPTCFYEFAKRYTLDGKLFHGFIPQSADKIFESTFRKKKSPTRGFIL